MPSPERGTSDDTHGDQVKNRRRPPVLYVLTDSLPDGGTSLRRGLTSVPLPSIPLTFFASSRAACLSSNHSATFALARSRRVSLDPRARAQSMFLPGRLRSSPWPICGIS